MMGLRAVLYTMIAIVWTGINTMVVRSLCTFLAAEVTILKTLETAKMPRLNNPFLATITHVRPAHLARLALLALIAAATGLLLISCESEPHRVCCTVIDDCSCLDYTKVVSDCPEVTVVSGCAAGKRDAGADGDPDSELLAAWPAIFRNILSNHMYCANELLIMTIKNVLSTVSLPLCLTIILSGCLVQSSPPRSQSGQANQGQGQSNPAGYAGGATASGCWGVSPVRLVRVEGRTTITRTLQPNGTVWDSRVPSFPIGEFHGDTYRSNLPDGAVYTCRRDGSVVDQSGRTQWAYRGDDLVMSGERTPLMFRAFQDKIVLFAGSPEGELRAEGMNPNNKRSALWIAAIRWDF